MLESPSATSSSLVEMRGSYVFAVTRKDELDDWSPRDGGQPLDLVECGDLVAISSPINLKEKGATGAMKGRHLRMLEGLASAVTHVPLQTGAAFSGTDAVHGFLDDCAEIFHEEMEQLGEAAESLIRLTWDVDDPVAHLAGKYDEIGELCDATDAGADPAEVARQVSQRYEEVLGYERRNHREVVYRRLAPYCREMRSLEGGDEELVRVRCLCDRDDFRDFECELYEIADDLGEATVFDLTEPEPPLSFLDDRLVI